MFLEAVEEDPQGVPALNMGFGARPPLRAHAPLGPPEGIESDGRVNLRP